MSRRTPEWVGQPQEVPDAEHEQLVARVCAVDVAKMSGRVCTRVPHAEQPHRRVCKVWDVAATTNAVTALADQLVELKIEKVTVESAADRSTPATSRTCRATQRRTSWTRCGWPS